MGSRGLKARRRGDDCPNVVEGFFEAHPEVKDRSDLVVLWSGGRDSTALLLLVADYKRNRDMNVTAVMVPYPNATIDEDGRSEAERFWAERGISLRVLDHQNEDTAEPKDPPKSSICLECKRIRRAVLTDYLFVSRNLSNTVIATGHNASDLAAYLVEVAVGGWSRAVPSRGTAPRERHLEVMNKFLPVYSPPNGPTVIRPMLAYDDDDVRQEILARGVRFPFAFVPRECPWLAQRKRILQKYFKDLGIRFDLASLVQYARLVCRLPEEGEYWTLPFQTYLL